MDLGFVNTLSLSAPNDSTIANINLYETRAQITRVFKANIGPGHNQMTISSLPDVVDHKSLRVEARGPAIIQMVTTSKVEMQERNDTSLLDELNEKWGRAKNTLERCKKARKAIDSYVDTLDVQQLDISELSEVMDIYDSTKEKWEEKIILVEKEIASLDKQITDEGLRLDKKVGKRNLRTQVVVGFYAESAIDLEISVIYGVSLAHWQAGYDICVDMQTPTRPVKVVYKANISQKTGETWENAPITLETTDPTFGLDIPVLPAWTLSHENTCAGEGLGEGCAMRRQIVDEDDLDYDITVVNYESMQVTSTGSVNATFRIPGRTTIPSNDEEHNDDTRVHLEANIKNSSAYTFLSGSSNIYVDQSFIARSYVPNVSPQETFHCRLGIDPSIRVTYHPRTKMFSESGFYNKPRTQSFSQRITIQNTKTVPIEGLKITDHIPVSQDANITVKLVEPALALPVASTLKLTGRGTPPTVQVSEGIIAQWNGSDDLNCDLSALGKNGKVDWLCTIPALGTVNLLLQWEVTTTQKATIYGLYVECECSSCIP